MPTIPDSAIADLTSKLDLPHMAGQVRRFVKFMGPVDVAGRRVLEIGAGDGVFSCLLSAAGAASVTSLEPELDGHSDGAFETLDRHIRRAGLQNVSLAKRTFQDFDAPDAAFDVIVSIASVNHLDEPMCERLTHDEQARAVYRDLFRKLHRLLAPGGHVVLADCGRHNLFSWTSRAIGLRNPLVPTIEWHKHQQPSFWAKLLVEAGFAKPRWRWLFAKSVPHAGRLVDNAVMSYLTGSTFALWAQRP